MFHKRGNSFPGPVCEPSVPSIKEEWRATTSDQPEGAEHINTLQTFQDGRAPSIKGNFGTKWLSMQIGPQSRLFFCSIEQTIKERCTFRMGGFPVRIPLSMSMSMSIPLSLSILRKFYIRTIRIPWRLSNTSENFGGNNLKQGHCDIPVTKSKICYKLKEISSSLNTENRVLGDDNKLSGGYSVPASGEGRVDFQKVSGYIVNTEGVNKRHNKSFGNIIISNLSNFSCTTVHEVPAETKNSQPLFEKRLQVQSSSRCRLVDIKPKSVKWEVSNFSLGRNFDTSKTGWKVFCQKTSIGEVFLQAEHTLHINILELKLRPSKFALLTFCRYKKRSSSSYANGQ